ncbi:hypothetical protein MF672_045295 [Actinomadura sp. ATCC 31491]|uniref:Uncharacterized protein n=1 Tax=Actinomadura luzonensis TaxID=2805427 RepID=A0ABT0G8P7_9ACTN|nr:hypothetical protein [Actinomadura luzonensis]MCK2220974.1 hypothetical protein [Actinomadura luzonensis]
MAMIDQWILQDERELEARCARFRAARLAMERGEDRDAEDEPGPALAGRPGQPGSAVTGRSR